MFGGDRQRAHASGLHHADRVGDVEPGDLDVAIGEVADDLGAAALERDVQEVEPGALGENLRVDLLITADAGAAVAHLAGMRFRVGDELGEGLGREVGRGREEEDRNVGELRDDLHVALVVDPQLLREQHRRQRVGRDIADHDRVAVGPRAGHLLDGDDARGAGLVLDHDALLECRPKPFGIEPRDHVGETAGRVRDDDLDRFGRIGALRRRRRCREGKKRQDQRFAPTHIPPIACYLFGAEQTVGGKIVWMRPGIAQAPTGAPGPAFLKGQTPLQGIGVNGKGTRCHTGRRPWPTLV